MSWWAGGGGGRQASPDQQLAAYRQQQGQGQGQGQGQEESMKAPSISSLAKSLLVTRRRLRLDPDSKLFFFYEPGKQVSSAVRIKNTSSSPVAFKFQTNAPKSCFMRPPHGILAPGESITASVLTFFMAESALHLRRSDRNSALAKFIEQPEPNQEKKCRDKFRIVSLKVKQGIEFTPELFEEQKEFVTVERVLRVVFLDPQGQSSEAEKLKKLLAEAEAAQEQQGKTESEEVLPNVAASVGGGGVVVGGGGGVLDEWKEQQREKRLAKQAAEGTTDSA